MAERQTHHPATPDNATLLLAAAEDLKLDKGVVRVEQNGLTAPDDVLDKAFPPKKAASKSTSKNEKE